MKLIILEEYEILKPCEIDGLPDFVILTGKNGAGKTKLLQSFHYAPMATQMLDDDGTLMDNVRIIGQGLYFSPEINESLYYEELKDKWKRLENLAFFGDSFVDQDPITENGASETLKKMIGVVGSTENGSSLTKFHLYDFQVIIDLCKKSGKKGKELTFSDYFTFHELPQGFLVDSLPLIFHQFALKRANYFHLVANEPAPWELFDDLLESAGFDYKLKKDPASYLIAPLSLNVTDLHGKNVIPVSQLSSGELTLLSLVTVLYNTKTVNTKGMLLLLDEPDAYLHPALTDKFLKAVKDILVGQRKMKVIMTTHSPSTVALAPADSIYAMDRDLGYPKQVDRDTAIRFLTKGLATLNVSLDDRKQIFTEAENDRKFYQLLFEKMVGQGKISNEQLLQFVPVTGDNNETGGGVEKVISLTNLLYNEGNGNKNIYGLIDWDCIEREKSDRVLVFGGKTRYNIENFIYDPLFIACLALQKNLPQKEPFGLNSGDDKIEFLSFDEIKLQKIIDTIAPKVFNEIIWESSDDQTDIPVQVSLLNGKTVFLPAWYLSINGHRLNTACLKAFPTLKSHNTEKMISDIVVPYYTFLPIEIRDTFIELQNRRMRED